MDNLKIILLLIALIATALVIGIVILSYYHALHPENAALWCETLNSSITLLN